MTEVQKILLKIAEFVHLETDADNPHLELTKRECEILLEASY